MTDILESYQNCLYVLANEENALGVFLRECSKIDKTKAGKVMAITGKSLTQSSHQRIRLYMPLVRLFQEMETFHSRAVSDTADTVDKLESRRSKYRASLLWMKDVSEKLNPDVYRELDKFRRVQNQVRSDKRAFDSVQMDVVQKIDLLMASRCNLMNQILAPYQAVLLETFENNQKSFDAAEALIKREDIHEYEFKTLKQLNPLPVIDEPEQQAENLLGDLSGENSQENCPDDDLLGSLTTEDLFGSFTANESSDSSKTEALRAKTSKEENLIRASQIENLIENAQIDDLFKNNSGSSALGDLMGSPPASGSVGSSNTGDLLGDFVSQCPEGSVSKSEPSVDLLTNELDEIDNSSYFKSLQSQIQL